MTDTLTTVDSLVHRVVDASLGTIDLIAMYLGDRLGWYRSLAADGPATPDELAARTGTDPRYAREWLEQQAVTGLLVASDGEPRRFTLPEAAARYSPTNTASTISARSRGCCAASRPTCPNWSPPTAPAAA